MKSLIAFTTVTIILCCSGRPVYGEDMEVNLVTIGRVYKTSEDSTYIGSAFAAGEQGNIYMAAHEAKIDTMWYRSFNPNPENHYSLKIGLKYKIDRYDLAVYGHSGGMAESLPFGKFFLTRPGDKVLYIGWERSRVLQAHVATVIAQGKHWYKGEEVEFIDLEGRGIRGYSGGPVLNENGQVIAVITSGWSEKCESDSTEYRIVRAHSLDLFRILDSHTIDVGDTSLSGSKLESVLMKKTSPQNSGSP